LAKDPISQYDFDLGVAAFQKAYTRFCNNQILVYALPV